MAQIINIPTVSPFYTVIVAAEKQPDIDISEAANGRKIIFITARDWTEAEKLRDKAQNALRKTR